MTSETIYVALGALGIGLVMGYLLGLHESKLVRKIRDLQNKKPSPPVAKPTITTGEYDNVDEYYTDTTSLVGLIEAKTPERMEFEAMERIEREGRGIKPN